jgi:cell division protein FtsL
MIIGFYIGFTNNTKTLILKDDFTVNNTNLFVLIAIVVVCIGIVFGLFWLFYKLLYGVLLRKLLSNYKELEKIED